MTVAASLPPIPLYLNYSANETADAAKSAQADPQAIALLQHFQAAAPNLTSANALLGDYKSLQVVLTAFGIGDRIGNTAVLRQLLTQDPTATTSLSYRLADAKYTAFARALSNWSPPPFANPQGVASIVSSYKTNRFELSADSQSAGLRTALYFTRSVGNVKTLAQLQTDPDLLKVVVTGLGLPLTNFGALDFTTQTQILTSKLDLKSLQDPVHVQRLAEQYLVSQQLLQAQTPTGPPPGSLVALFGGGDTSGNSVLQILLPSSTGTSTAGTASSLLSLFA